MIFNLGQLCARQVPCLLYYQSSSSPVFISNGGIPNESSSSGEFSRESSGKRTSGLLRILTPRLIASVKQCLPQLGKCLLGKGRKNLNESQ